MNFIVFTWEWQNIYGISDGNGILCAMNIDTICVTRNVRTMVFMEIQETKLWWLLKRWSISIQLNGLFKMFFNICYPKTGLWMLISNNSMKIYTIKYKTSKFNQIWNWNFPAVNEFELINRIWSALWALKMKLGIVNSCKKNLIGMYDCIFRSQFMSKCSWLQSYREEISWMHFDAFNKHLYLNLVWMVLFLEYSI